MEIRPLLQDAMRAFANGLMRGTECPCCGRYARLNRVSIHASMARSLAWIAGESHPAVDDGWVDVPGLAPRWLINSRTHTKLVFWGLLEQKENTGTKTKHSGIYRPTSDGRAFVAGLLKVKKFVIMYDGEVKAQDGEYVDINDCFGEPFDYDKMVRRWT